MVKSPYRYLHQIKGRYIVRRPVPPELFGRILGTRGKPIKIIETHLKTGDFREANLRAPQALADIEKRLRRAKDGSSLADEALLEIADTEMRRAYDLMAAQPLHFADQIAGFSYAISHDPAGLGIKAENPSPFLSGLTIWQFAESQLRRLEPDPSSERIEKLTMLIWQAHRLAVDRYQAGTALPPALPLSLNSPLISSISKPPSIGGRCFREVVESYFGHPETELSPVWAKSCRTTYRLFQDHISDGPFASITRQQVDSFAIALSGLRGTWGQYTGAKAMKFADLLKRFPASNGDGISGSTINRHLAALGALWKFAQRRGLIEINLPTPFASQRRKVEKPKNEPIAISDLNKLLGGNTDATLQWAMLVSLFSGMRASEVGNLTAAEVRQSEKGKWYFDLTERKVTGEGPDRVKNENAKRVIPIHDKLVGRGFLDFVPGKGWVFATIKSRPGGRGEPLGDKFTTLADKCGVSATFRELRNTFQDACDRAGLPEPHPQLLMGHKRGFSSATYNRKGLGPDDLAGSMAEITYPGLEIPELGKPSKVKAKRAE
jgi:integrase